MKLNILCLAGCVAFAACGGSAGNNANNTASKNTNSTAQTSPTAEPKKDLPPTSMYISDFLSSYDQANEGRIVTVTGGNLDEISYTSLLIRDGSGYAFHCNGSFSDYMDMKTTIDDLRAKHRSPQATVKGTYAKGPGSSPDLSNCVLTDVKK